MNGNDLNKAEDAAFVQRPAIVRETRPGIKVTRIEFPTHQELHLSLMPISGEKPLDMSSRLAGLLEVHDAVVVRHEIFGSLTVHAETMQALRHNVEEFDWPVTWVEGKTGSKPVLSGMHIFAVVGTNVETICRDGQPMGRVFSDGSFKHCFLGGITSSNPNAMKADQGREVLERLADILKDAGMDMTNLVRTWFFLDDILGWYGDFNRVRNEFFLREKVFDGLVPASTGIGGRNPAGGALVAGVWAVQPISKFAKVREVVSPLQCPATKYGSAFSRAVLLEGESLRRLLVSGTSSIEPDGNSAHVGDMIKQIQMSKSVIQVMLNSCGFDFDDVSRATGYIKDQYNASSPELCSGHYWQPVTVQADICRPELLFEIEVDALRVV
jgi:enamine deaminase RidA (YjgF/YER057c/UK114 family)